MRGVFYFGRNTIPMAHLPAWIEIPVTDLDRAENFYSSIMGIEFRRMNLGNGLILSLFPTKPNEVGGALACLPSHYHPGETGPLVYLNTESVEACINLVEDAGGVVIVPLTKISEERGYMAVFRDSEGNRVGIMGSM